MLIRDIVLPDQLSQVLDGWSLEVASSRSADHTMKLPGAADSQELAMAFQRRFR